MAIFSTLRRAILTIVPKRNSLSTRLIVISAVWVFLCLAAGAYLLSNFFTETVADNFDTALQVDFDGLIAAADPEDAGAVEINPRFLNRRFSRIYSGLYWQIEPLNGGGVQVSRSLYDRRIVIEKPEATADVVWGFAKGPNHQHLRVLAQKIYFPAEDGQPARAYRFVVASSLARAERQIADFNSILCRAFAMLGGGVLLVIFIQVQIGLAPLRRVKTALARIRDGQAQQLEGTFPAEIAPLAEELNSLIAHSIEVVGRARTHVGNLAHFFKTPLSVLASEADAAPGPLAEAVKRQVAVMRRQVDYYLSRARAAGSVNVLGSRTPVAEVLDALTRTLGRIYHERVLDLGFECPADLYFRGERQDFEEMAGNLIDNACKWTRSEVRVSAAPAAPGWFVLTVDDNGPGLSPADRERVLVRGARLDESVPGSGLGLSIVRDIAKLYGGDIQFGKSPAGGLSVRLTLPSAAR